MKAPKILNIDQLSSESHILLPNCLNGDELSYLLEVLSDRPVTVLAEEGYPVHEDIKKIVEERSLSAIAFSAEDPYLADVGTNLESRLGEGGIALFLSPPVHTPSGGFMDIPTNISKALCSLGLSVCTLSIHRTEGNNLRMEDLSAESSAIMSIGNLLRSSNVSIPNIQQEMLMGAEKAFSARAFLNGSLGEYLLKSLHANGVQNSLFDGNDNTEISYQRILAASLALSDYIKKSTAKLRVGIVLPPGKGGMIANLAVIFAGKVPVNLNFTSSKEAIKHCMKVADLDILVSAQPAVEKLNNFPWPAREGILLLDELVPMLKPKVFKWLLKMKVSSAERIIKQRGLEKRGNDDEAVLLFTSGSSGMPKGVPLSHRNLLANVCQFSTRIGCSTDIKLLGCLPLFHSFGCTVTMLYPFMEGRDLVTFPSPLDPKKLGELIEKHEVTLLTATPTFLRGYLKRVSPEQLKSLNLVVTGAEKLPKNLADNFEKRFGLRPLEGYGLTETSPASHLNIPDYEEEDGKVTLKSTKHGTVGMPLAGVAMRITDTATGEQKALNQKGCLWMKGANIFNGYLDQPELGNEIFQDGWFNTGDIGSVDEEGFLTLEGRLSRFSKIAGEMVPHETVENEINKILGLDEQEDRKIAVLGVPDEKKGEALLLLSSIPEDDVRAFIIDLKVQLISKDIPALWCPKTLVYTPKIPILGSGKLDIATCKKLAEEAVS